LVPQEGGRKGRKVLAHLFGKETKGEGGKKREDRKGPTLSEKKGGGKKERSAILYNRSVEKGENRVTTREERSFSLRPAQEKRKKKRGQSPTDLGGKRKRLEEKKKQKGDNARFLGRRRREDEGPAPRPPEGKGARGGKKGGKKKRPNFGLEGGKGVCSAVLRSRSARNITGKKKKGGADMR